MLHYEILIALLPFICLDIILLFRAVTVCVFFVFYFGVFFFFFFFFFVGGPGEARVVTIKIWVDNKRKAIHERKVVHFVNFQ